MDYYRIEKTIAFWAMVVMAEVMIVAGWNPLWTAPWLVACLVLRAADIKAWLRG